MRKCALVFLTAMAPLLFSPLIWAGQPLSLTRTFRMPSAVTGHFDHMTVDLSSHRLFVTPEGYNSVIVFDDASGKILHVIKGIGVPHAVLFRSDLNRLYVTDGQPGALKIYDGKTYRLLKSITLLTHTDSVKYDPATKYLYIVTGGKQAHQSHTMIAVVDTTSEKLLGEIPVDGDAVEAMAIESNGARLYVNNTARNRVDVLDRKTRKVIASWPITLGHDNTSMALDEARHRLFVGCRSGSLVIFNTQTGKELGSLPMETGVDDMIFDPSTRRIYASCGGGAGMVYVYVEDGNHYRVLARVPSGPMGKTSLLSDELHELFVAVPRHGSTDAAILVYAVH